MDYVIIVNDNGELKSISAAEFETGMTDRQKIAIGRLLNIVLDARAALTALHADDSELPEYGDN